MNRPYVFCYMAPSLNGKIKGSYRKKLEEENSDATKLFYVEGFTPEGRYGDNQGVMCGRLTTDENLTKFKKPELDTNAEIVKAGDFIAKDINLDNKFYISVDPKGKIAWQNSTIKFGNLTNNIIEIITNETSNEYKYFLRRKNISYIIAGDKNIDFETALMKLKQLFKIERLMLGGGGILNWSLIQQNLCDEISLLVMPTADGNSDTPSLFQSKDGLSGDKPVSFNLKTVEQKGNIAWLTYTINNNNN